MTYLKIKKSIIVCLAISFVQVGSILSSDCKDLDLSSATRSLLLSGFESSLFAAKETASFISNRPEIAVVAIGLVADKYRRYYNRHAKPLENILHNPSQFYQDISANRNGRRSGWDWRDSWEISCDDTSALVANVITPAPFLLQKLYIIPKTLQYYSYATQKDSFDFKIQYSEKVLGFLSEKMKRNEDICYLGFGAQSLLPDLTNACKILNSSMGNLKIIICSNKELPSCDEHIKYYAPIYDNEPERFEIFKHFLQEHYPNRVTFVNYSPFIVKGKEVSVAKDFNIKDICDNAPDVICGADFIDYVYDDQYISNHCYKELSVRGEFILSIMKQMNRTIPNIFLTLNKKYGNKEYDRHFLFQSYFFEPKEECSSEFQNADSTKIIIKRKYNKKLKRIEIIKKEYREEEVKKTHTVLREVPFCNGEFAALKKLLDNDNLIKPILKERVPVTNFEKEFILQKREVVGYFTQEEAKTLDGRFIRIPAQTVEENVFRYNESEKRELIEKRLGFPFKGFASWRSGKK